MGTVKEPFVVETVLLSIRPCAHNPKITTSTFIHKLTNRFLLLRFHCLRDSKVRIVLGGIRERNCSYALETQFQDIYHQELVVMGGTMGTGTFKPG